MFVSSFIYASSYHDLCHFFFGMAASFMNVKILLHLGRDVMEESGCVMNLFSIVLMCVYVMKQVILCYSGYPMEIPSRSPQSSK